MMLSRASLSLTHNQISSVCDSFRSTRSLFVIGRWLHCLSQSKSHYSLASRHLQEGEAFSKCDMNYTYIAWLTASARYQQAYGRNSYVILQMSCTSYLRLYNAFECIAFQQRFYWKVLAWLGPRALSSPFNDEESFLHSLGLLACEAISTSLQVSLTQFRSFS